MKSRSLVIRKANGFLTSQVLLYSYVIGTLIADHYNQRGVSACSDVQHWRYLSSAITATESDPVTGEKEALRQVQNLSPHVNGRVREKFADRVSFSSTCTANTTDFSAFLSRHLEIDSK